MHKTWFLTGASRGFGRAWTIAALERGDRVAATARDASTLDDLLERFGDAVLPLTLDVTDAAAATAAVDRAHAHFGRLDVVVNNAGYGHFGFAEEVTEAELRAQMETNFFGAVAVTQAALPHLRAQGSGHVLQVTSIGGISAFPIWSAYHASKWALEGWTQAMAQEVAPFGIRTTLIEPGGFETDWSGSSARHSERMDEYEALHARVDEMRAQVAAHRGDPTASARAVLALVDADEPPLRAFLGTSPLSIAKADYEKRLADWEAWQDNAVLAQG
ncbi:SDR family NAD(P)-dependent oxidoreductase [Nocardioides sp. GY 10127]|nr:SDR family NAD(P)-dependent oxidoreductase [Nocardioides sp. GY 10127]